MVSPSTVSVSSDTLYGIDFQSMSLTKMVESGSLEVSIASKVAGSAGIGSTEMVSVVVSIIVSIIVVGMVVLDATGATAGAGTWRSGQAWAGRCAGSVVVSIAVSTIVSIEVTGMVNVEPAGWRESTCTPATAEWLFSRGDRW